jgi:hypothetical protein
VHTAVGDEVSQSLYSRITSTTRRWRWFAVTKKRRRPSALGCTGLLFLTPPLHATSCSDACSMADAYVL